jgi:hypothetical protein
VPGHDRILKKILDLFLKRSLVDKTLRISKEANPIRSSEHTVYHESREGC